MNCRLRALLCSAGLAFSFATELGVLHEEVRLGPHNDGGVAYESNGAGFSHAQGRREASHVRYMVFKDLCR